MTTAVRADARRNREIVLSTAMRVFAEEGMDVSLGRIARRAGVGAGTVYRHFPSKEILIEAVLAEHVDGLVAAAGRWAERAAPGDALFGFLLDVVERSAGRRHVCDAIAGDRGWPRALLAGASRRFAEARDRLLRNAQRAGAVRPDVRPDDLAALIVGAAAVRAAHPDPARADRMVRILLDVLRTPAVTKAAPLRDALLRRHETTPRGAGRCAECGSTIRIHPTGRPPRYCGPTCRQRARRRRAAG